MRSVDVLFDEKRARIVIEKGKFDEAAATAALEKAGFGGGKRVN